MKTFKKLLIGMVLFSLTSSNMIVNLTPVYAVESDEGRVATEDETYYATGFHSQSSDRHFANYCDCLSSFLSLAQPDLHTISYDAMHYGFIFNFSTFWRQL